MLEQTSSPAVTIVDIAKAAGVSHSTVSRVLNNKQYIKAETRERVLRCITDLGYVPNRPARRLAGGRLGVVALVMSSLVGGYKLELVKNVQRALADADFETLIVIDEAPDFGPPRPLNPLGGLIDGMIVAMPHPERRAVLDQGTIPTVLLDHDAIEGIDAVTTDHRVGAIAAVAHLARLGHRRIAHITGNLDFHPAQQRLAGFCDAIARYGLDDDPALIRTGDFRVDRATEAAGELLALVERPTALVAVNDDTAIAAMRVFQDAGIEVPAAMSIIGFDDVPVASQVRPALTTVGQPLEEMATAAVSLLVDRFDITLGQPRTVVAESKLIERATTAARH